MLAIVAAAGYRFCCIFYRRFNVQFNIMTPLCMKCPMRNEGRRPKKKKKQKKETLERVSNGSEYRVAKAT